MIAVTYVPAAVPVALPQKVFATQFGVPKLTFVGATVPLAPLIVDVHEPIVIFGEAVKPLVVTV